MSADGFLPVQAEAAVAVGLLDTLRADADIKAVFGDPPRLFDDETGAAIMPYARLERHEVQPAGASLVEAQTHRITLVTISRHGGRVEAKEAIGAIRAAIDRADLVVAGQTVVSAQVIYSDVMRTRDQRHFRGIVQVRIISERAMP